MLEYDKIGVSEGIGVNKTTVSQEHIICHYWYFHEINFRFQPKVCKECHDLMLKAMSFNNVAIFSIKGNNCRIYFRYMSKGEAINLFLLVKKIMNIVLVTKTMIIKLNRHA